MHRSSQTIGAIAAALAKAQIELANPEKSLTASIPSPSPRGTDQSFRYASLANGLDLVRKSLGRHEIATVQTTSIDDGAGLIRLTTTLAHASGEWVSSDWPVCPVSETATPHRMGAALTYARRYALFTLVGIAGEDDLDAPDLPRAGGVLPTPASDQANGHMMGVQPPGASGNTRRRTWRAPSPLPLAAEASVSLRERLLTELDTLGTIEELDRWAQSCLPAKNTLAASDARLLEQAFERKLAALEMPTVGIESAEPPMPAGSEPRAAETTPPPMGESVLAFPKPRRHRDKIHLRFVAQQSCLICARQPCDAHHLRFAQPRGYGLKVSDEFTVPLCRGHHRELHRAANEPRWWARLGIDVVAVAHKLWAETHPLGSSVSAIDADVAAADAAAAAPKTMPKRARTAVATINDQTKPIPIARPPS